MESDQVFPEEGGAEVPRGSLKTQHQTVIGYYIRHKTGIAPFVPL
jgi:hypothetical protein